MDKKGKSKISWIFDIAGVILIILSIFIIKLSTNPLIEIIGGILATVGFGLVAGAKYVWYNKWAVLGINTRDYLIAYCR